MPDPEPLVIAGGGLAAAKSAEALRAEGFDGHIVLIGKESHLPYERPPLSKGHLQGGGDPDKIFVHQRSWYDEHGIELRLGIEATSIDAEGHQIFLNGGDRIGYDKSLLATGSLPRPLPVPGADLPTVRYLRTIEDSERLRIAFSARLPVNRAKLADPDTPLDRVAQP